MMKDYIMCVRLDPIERNRVEQLARDMGIQRCELIRHLIKVASDRIIANLPPVIR